jgi:predicted phage tail protein
LGVAYACCYLCVGGWLFRMASSGSVVMLAHVGWSMCVLGLRSEI